MNDKNLLFYHNIELDHFKALSEKGGFSACKDLDLISPEIAIKDSIVELGAGYGRCLNYYVQNGHQGKLTGVEYSKPYVAILNKKFAGKADIIQADIKLLNLNLTFDVALWMWSGIIDFSPTEQLESCKNIFNHLNKNGRLIIDVPRLGVQTIANHLDSQHLVFETIYGEIHAYIPDDADMESIKESAGFTQLKKIEYLTATDKQRTIYILVK